MLSIESGKHEKARGTTNFYLIIILRNLISLLQNR